MCLSMTKARNLALPAYCSNLLVSGPEIVSSPFRAPRNDKCGKDSVINNVISSEARNPYDVSLESPVSGTEGIPPSLNPLVTIKNIGIYYPFRDTSIEGEIKPPRIAAYCKKPQDTDKMRALSLLRFE